MADGIPFPQAPQPRIANPLETASQMQGLATRGIEAQRAQQALEQQAQDYAAKQAFGQMMQQHICLLYTSPSPRDS